MTTPRNRIALLLSLAAGGLGMACVTLIPMPRAEEAARPQRADTAEEKRWQAVAPGRVEPASGEVRLATPIMGLIGEVLVRANDKVTAGEPLIRLTDSEAQARLASAEAQVALRRRVRNDEAAPIRAATRRRAEDAVTDAERSLIEAQAAFDKVAVDRRTGSATAADLDGARAALTRAEERLRQQKAELRRIEADPATPLPSQAEGQLNVARAELAAAQAAFGKLTIRAPRDGTVLQVNTKAGELANGSGSQPLMLLGDISALRVRAELDERDFGEIKVGQQAVVRAAAFRGKEFIGKVSSIAPLVVAGRINPRGQRTVSDVDVVEVLIDLAESEPLAVGMKVNVYFQQQ